MIRCWYLSVDDGVCAKEHGTEHHRQCAEGSNAGRDVGFLVKSTAHLDEMQRTVAVQGKFNQSQEPAIHAAHALRSCSASEKASFAFTWS